MEGKDIREYNVGKSDYAKHKIQPWDIWEEYSLNPWDADIVKRVLRNKEGEERVTEYEKIIHICKKRIEQLKKVKHELKRLSKRSFRNSSVSKRIQNYLSSFRDNRRSRRGF